MSSAKVLVVLEGEKPEENTLARLQGAFPEELADLSKDLVEYVYSSHIYGLYHKLKEDDGFSDVIEVLKELYPDDDTLQNTNREDISQVYLFFDLDIHKQPIEKSCEQLNELIQFFDKRSKPNMGISEEIKEKRKALGLTQKDFQMH